MLYFATLLLFVHFFVAEAIVRKGKVAKSIKRTTYDNGSSLLIGATFCLIFLMTVSVHFLRDLHHNTLPTLGLFLMILASVIRIWAATTLGSYYTRTLVIVDTQRLVKSGPYRHIRHPGYLGMILLWLGFSLTSASLVVVAISGLLLFSVYLYRIRCEERMLIDLFKQDYADYKKHSYKLIPFIL